MASSRARPSRARSLSSVRWHPTSDGVTSSSGGSVDR